MIVDPGNPGGDGLASGTSRTAVWWTRLGWARRLKWWGCLLVAFIAYIEYLTWDGFYHKFNEVLAQLAHCEGLACLEVSGRLLECISFHGFFVFWIVLALVGKSIAVRNGLLLLGSLLYPYVWQCTLVTRLKRVFVMVAVLAWSAAIMSRSPMMFFWVGVLSFLMMLLRLTLLRRYDPETDTWRNQFREIFFGKTVPVVKPESDATSPLA